MVDYTENYIKQFDNETIEYDTSKYPLSQSILEMVQHYYPQIDKIENTHKYLSHNEVHGLFTQVSKDLANNKFMDMIDGIVQENIKEKLDIDFLIQKYGNLRMVVPQQNKYGQVLSFHQGRWVGNGLGLRTVWFPFTEVFDSNSLQILSLEDSRRITRQAIKEQWSYKYFQDVCEKYMFPVNKSVGQIHLFTQEHIHGNIPNRTNITRASMDLRILLENGQFHRKWPGGYFRKLWDRSLNDVLTINNNDTYCCYAEFDNIKTRHIDLIFQNFTIKNYCEKRDIKIPYQQPENEGMMNHHLEYMIYNENYDHIIFFSIFSLPDNEEQRKRLIEKALERNIKLHFANEDLFINNKDTYNKVEYIRNFSKDYSSPVEQLHYEIYGKYRFNNFKTV